MANYTKTTNFAAKDALPSGSAGKIIKGTEINTEFDNIVAAIASKADANNSTLTGNTTAVNLSVSGTFTATVDGGTY